MANTLTGLIPVMYAGLHRASRELIGFIPAVRRDINAESMGIGQTVRSPIGVSGPLEDIVPGAAPPDSGDTTTEYVDVTITKSKAAPIRWTGEEQLLVDNVINPVLVDQFADAIRKLANAIELDIATAAYKAASRAYGTAGTAPFGTAGDLTDFANINKILDDNGAPTTGRNLVLNSAAMVNLRGKQSVLFKVNEAGSDDMLRDGMTDRVQSLAIRYSSQLSTHTKGTGASYITADSAGYAIGAKTIEVDGGTGTVLAGDVVTFAGDSNKYVVNTALTGGAIVLGKPGLRATLANNVAMTVGNSFTPNVAFSDDAVILAARQPAMPTGGDAAEDVTTIQDPFSGLIFQVALYREYRRIKYEVGLAWGVGVGNSAHIATLLG